MTTYETLMVFIGISGLFLSLLGILVALLIEYIKK